MTSRGSSTSNDAGLLTEVGRRPVALQVKRAASNTSAPTRPKQEPSTPRGPLLPAFQGDSVTRPGEHARYVGHKQKPGGARSTRGRLRNPR